MDEYLSQCSNLSVTAQLAISLLMFERFCDLHQLKSKQIDEFSAYLWKWPLIDGPDVFDSWVESRPDLVNYGLSDAATPELLGILASADIDEYRFRKIVGGIVNILWTNLWGSVEKELSTELFETAARATKLVSFPPLTPFKFSIFSDSGGWGERITQADRDYWRSCFN